MSVAAIRTAEDRPVPFRKREDLVFESIAAGGLNTTVVKDPCLLKYTRLFPEQATILSLLDGVMNLRQIRLEVEKRHMSCHVTIRDIQAVILDLFQKRLLISERPGQGPLLLQQGRREKWSSILKSLTNPLYIQFPGWDPTRLLQILLPVTRWLFWKSTAFVMTVFIAFAGLFALMHYDSVQARLPEFEQFFGLQNLPWLWLSLACCKCVHEMGHGLSCVYFDARCHSMGVMLMLFSPTLYCDVSDSWMLRSKWKRIAIAAGGIYFESILSSISIIIWWNTRPGLLNYLALNMFFVSAVTTVVFNANPFLRRFDGYFMFSDWVEVPNLRERADARLQMLLNQLMLGKKDQGVVRPGESGPLLIAYALAARCYGIFIFWSIAMVMYRWLAPYHLANVWLLVTLLFTGWTGGKRIKVWIEKLGPAFRGETSRWRLITVFIFSAVSISLFFLVPIPWSVSVPAYVEPGSVVQVFAPDDGILRQMPLQEGQHVLAGQTLARILDPTLEREALRLAVERDSAQARIVEASALQNPDDRMIAAEQAAAAKKELMEVQNRIERLTVRAPISGIVVFVSDTPGSDPGKTMQLPGWSGTPLQSENDGLMIRKQTPICAIAPDESFSVVMLIDQSDRQFIGQGTDVDLRLDHLPWQVIQGKVETVSDEPVTTTPKVLSTRFGGVLPTEPGPEGDAALFVAYPAAVGIPNSTRIPVVADMRGRVIVPVRGMSLSNWGWYFFRKTFLFDL